MRLLVTGLTWPQVVALKSDYRKEGIEAGETCGALAVHLFGWESNAAEWSDKVHAIAKKHCGKVSAGQTMGELRFSDPERYQRNIDAMVSEAVE